MTPITAPAFATLISGLVLLVLLVLINLGSVALAILGLIGLVFLFAGLASFAVNPREADGDE